MKRREVIAVLTAVTIGVRPGFAYAQTNGLKRVGVVSTRAALTELGGVRTGALAGYGPDFREYGRRPAGYVARILAGTLPRDLPVEAINRPGLAINLTANELPAGVLPSLGAARGPLDRGPRRHQRP